VIRAGTWPLAQLSFDIGERYRRVRLTVNETGVTMTARRNPADRLVLHRDQITAVGWSRWLIRRGQLWLYTAQSPVGFVVVLRLTHRQAGDVAQHLGLPLRHADPAPRTSPAAEANTQPRDDANTQSKKSGRS
jgi:hypothetical protein